MEIQQGKGPWASPVTGIVPLGTTLTMVVGIDDKEGMYIFIFFKRQLQVLLEGEYSQIQLNEYIKIQFYVSLDSIH